MALVAAIPVVALFNVFGQRPETSTFVVPAASLKVYAPTTVRGGLFFEGRFHITARQDIKDAFLVLGPGWAEGMSINTIEPSPSNETSENGNLSFELGKIPAGESFILFMQFQVNATNVGWRRPQTVELRDGKTSLISYKRTMTVYP
jgi:hypothetical protein